MIEQSTLDHTHSKLITLVVSMLVPLAYTASALPCELVAASAGSAVVDVESENERHAVYVRAPDRLCPLFDASTSFM